MENKQIANKYLVLQKIGNGSFGIIYKGENIRTKERIAIKIEPIFQNTKLLKNESIIYNYLKEIDGVPNIKWYGKDKINYYMVISLLGNSLQTTRENLNINFSINYLTSISNQILFLIQSIHRKGIIHRDIKPDNFLFEINSDKLFLIDFGLSKFYLNENKHISNKKTNFIIGSVNFTSYHSHENNELSRRDDLISLGYIMIFLYLGKLEWSNINLKENNELIIDLKKNILKNDNLPLFIRYYLIYCYSLRFDEEPNYFYLIDLLKIN